MKLKHRKLILIISMSAMGFGLITFSVAGSRKNKDAIESVNFGTSIPQDEITVTPSQEGTDTVTPTEEVAITETPTEEVTPTPTEEVGKLEEDAIPEINDLIKKFLQAKLDAKEKKLKKLVTDPTYIDVEDMQKKTEFIESYDNIKVYTKEGSGDIDYIAYVYMEVKIASIDTKAPGLNEFYVKKVGDSYKIVLGEISDDTADYIAESKKSDEVQALLAKVNKKLDKAIKKDSDLEEFCKKLSNTSEE